MTTGLIFDIKRFAIHDGPGVRLTVFFKGCPLRCSWCHNPEGIDSSQQTVQREHKIGDRTLGWEKETVGRYYSVAQLMAEIEKEVIFFDDSGGGVTFSGGEPLLQLDFLAEVLKQCRKAEIHTALDTSGFAPFESLARILGDVDLFLYDIKPLIDAEHRRHTGVSNKLILENLRKLAAHHKRIYLRLPIIPGITDTPDQFEALMALLKEMPSLRHLCLLPFHNIATAKYERFDMVNKFNGVKSLTNDDLSPLKQVLEANGFTVTLGG